MRLSPRGFAPVLPLTVALLAACSSDGGNEPGGEITGVVTDTPSVCTRSIPPLTTGPVTGDRLQAAIQKMKEVQAAAESGDNAGARAAFAGDTHAVTHDIDEPLRAEDPLLAEDLCESILFLELQFGAENDLQAVAGEAAISVRLLEESGLALGLSE